MVGTRSVDGKPVATPENAHTEPPFQHPNKMDVGSGDKRSLDRRGRKPRKPRPAKDADENPKGPKE